MLMMVAATSAMLAGCEPESYSQKTEAKEQTGGGSSTGDGGSEITSDPVSGNDGSDIDISSFDMYMATFTSCTYESLGTLGSADGYLFFLADDNFDWTTESGEGCWAIVELFTKAGSGIAPGKYCLDDTMAAGTAYICEVGDDDTVSGAMYGEGGYAVVCPDAGYVEISKSGDTYTFKITYIDQTYEGVFNGSFTGQLEEEETPAIGDETAVFTQCEAVFYGEYGGTGDWGIYLGDSKTDMSDLSGGAWAMIEIYTSSTSYSSTLPTGTFAINDTEQAGTAASIYEDGDYCYGTMYGVGDNIYVGATRGSVKISRNGTDYTIEMDFIDDDYGTSFNSTYNGKVSISDQSKSSRKDYFWSKEVRRRLNGSLPSFKVLN